MINKRPSKLRHAGSTVIMTLIIWILFLPAGRIQAQQPKEASEAPRPEMVLLQGHRQPIEKILFLPDQKLLASVDREDRLIFWEASSGEALRVIQLPEFTYSREMKLSGDGRIIEFFNNSGVGERIAYDVTSGKPINICPAGTESKKVSPNGKLAVCAKSVNPRVEPQNDSGHFLWDVENHRQVFQIAEKASKYPVFRFSPDSRILIISQGVALRMVEVTSGATIRGFQNLEFTGFSADGRNLYLSTPPRSACACDKPRQKGLADLAFGGAVEILDTNTAGRKRRLIGRQLLGFSPDGKTAVLRRKIASTQSATIEFWDAELTTLKRTIPGRFHHFQFSPDGRMMILESSPGSIDLENELWYKSVEYPREISLYDWQSGEKRAKLWEDKPDIAEYAFSADGSTITTVSVNGVARLLDGRSGVTLKTLRMISPPTGDSINGEMPVFSTPRTGFNPIITISADGQIVCGVQETRIVIADLKNSRVIHTAEGTRQSHESNFLFLQAGPDQLLAQSAADLPVVIWNLKTMQAGQAPTTSSDREESDSDKDNSLVVISPNGRLRAEQGNDQKSVAIIDAATGNRLHLLSGHNGMITEMGFAPDGKTLLTKSGFPSMGVAQNALFLFAVMMANEKEKEKIDQKIEALRGDRTVRLWDVESGKLKRTFQLKGDLREAKYLGAGEGIVTLHTEKINDQTMPEQIIVTAWDSETGEDTNIIRAEIGFNIILTPDGVTTVIYNDRKISALETLTGRLIWESNELAIAPLNDPFIAEGRFLAVKPAEDFEFRLVETQTGRERFRLPVDNFMFMPSVSADGRVLQMVVDSTAYFLDLEKNDRLWSAKVMNDSRGASFSPDGKIAGLQVEPETVELRDAAGGRLLLTLSVFPGEQAGQAEWIAYTPEGNYTASPGAARYIRWRVGDKLLPAEAHAGEFNRPDLVLRALQGK